MKREASKLGSSYYPPRARLHVPLRNMRDAVARQFQGVYKLLPSGVSLGQMALGFWVPGYSFFLRRHNIAAGLVFGGWGLALACFGVLLGGPPAVAAVVFDESFQFDPAYLALGIAVSIHATAATYLLTKLLGIETFGGRIFAGFGVTGFLIFAIYFPIWRLVQHHVLPVGAAEYERAVTTTRFLSEAA